MKKVIVLLSTYNGEQYLLEQLESLREQQDVDISVQIRDDGSKDDTLSILKSYCSKYENFSYYSGQNVGPANSFLDLVSNAGDADYYALCDQDDVWEKDKLIHAVEILELNKKDIPKLYHSNLKIVDSNLNFCRYGDKRRGKTSRYNGFVESICTGCTMVFNSKLKVLLEKRHPVKITMHDTWIYMVCKIFGEVIYDDNAYILYRQHGHNVIGMNQEKESGLSGKSLMSRIKNKKRQPRKMNAASFIECYGDVVSKKDKAKIEKLIKYDSNILSKLILFFDISIRASSLKAEMQYRASIIFGVV